MLNNRRKLTVSISLSGAILIIGVLALLYILTPRLTKEQAENRVRLCLKYKISAKHMEQLKQSGESLPDYETARRWEEEIKRINKLKFVSVSIKRPLPDILLGFDTPIWVVRVIILDEASKPEIHYFWLSRDGPDRKISKWAWIFSI